MKRVLVVEDSAMVTKVIRHVMAQSECFVTDYAATFAQAKALIEANDYFAAVVDLTLPDASDNDVADYTLEHKIPTLVLTSSFDDKRSADLFNKGIVDYVTKEGRYSYEFARSTIERLIKNKRSKVLVVDDSSTQRRVLKKLLSLHLFEVLEAKDGVDAIDVIVNNPDIKMVITDYNMPNMDGFDLIKNIRCKYDKSDVICIGVSSEGKGSLSAKFIKYGANDFLNKPFNPEEFYCRINQNMEFRELVAQVKDAANRDEKTGAYSKFHFFQKGAELHTQAKTHGAPISLAIIDFDCLQEYDTDVAERAIKVLAARLEKAFERFFIAKADGTEFYALLPGLCKDKAAEYLDRVRQVLIAEEVVAGADESVRINFSAGISDHLGEAIEDLVEQAYVCLNRSIEAGGGLVIVD